MSAPAVSVIMAVHNGADYVREAACSVLSQTHRQLELIVVDDGSSDGSGDIVRRLGDDRVRVVRQQQSGVAGARNRGLAEAEHDMIAFIDHDDIWFADKLSTQLPRFDADDVGVVGSYMTYLSDRGPTRATSGQRCDEQLERIAEARLMPFPLSSMVARAHLVQRLGGFDATLAEVGQVEDLDLLSRIARQARIVTVPRPLGYYRVHGGAASFRTFYQMRRGTRFLQDRVEATAAGEELTWEEWSSTMRESWNQRRRDRARFLYRTAGFQIVSGRRSRGMGNLVFASALAPGYVVPRLRRQLLT